VILRVNQSSRSRCVGVAALAIVVISCSPGEPQQPEAIPVEAIPVEPIGVEPSLPDRTIWEGVYTEAQRIRGEAVYGSACLRCHGEALEGDDVVDELVGEAFLERWRRKKVGNLYSFIKEEMPPELEHRLTTREYADVLAYILSKNEAPVGDDELVNDFAGLMAIKMSRSE